MNQNFCFEDFRSGNEDAFKMIYEEYRTRLFYFTSKYVPEPEVAEDIVQEAFVKVWQRRSNFSDPDAVKAFLYISVKNQCFNFRKHSKVVYLYSNSHKEEIAEEEIMNHILESEVLDRVFKALEKLPRGCRDVMHLSYFEELKNKEVADILKISVNTVKTQKRRGLSLLKVVLKSFSFLGLF